MNSVSTHRFARERHSKFWIIAVAFSIIGVLGLFGQQQSASQPGPRVQNADKTETKEQPTPTAPDIAKPATESEPQRETENCSYLQKIHNYLKKSVAPEYLSNWMLFLAAALGVGFAWSTLTTLIRQTESTKIAAEAGKVSADAAWASVQTVISAERSWIIGVLPTDSDTVNLFGHPASIPKCSIGITNSGRTPGKVITFCLKFEKMTTLTELEPEPYFGVDSIKGLGNHLIFPSEIPIWLTIDIKGEKPLSQEERFAVSKSELYLVCWGEINYEGVIKKEPHVSRFCYVYTYGTHGNRNAFQTCFNAPASYRENT